MLGGGALFAAFPMVYASLFSGFYAAMMLVLLVLILRTVAIEFRSKRPSARWRSLWDWVFFGSSLGIALLLGVAFGNIMEGVLLNAQGNIEGGLLDLLNPFALLLGVTTVFMLATHGAIYLSMKTDGELLVRVKRWIPRLMIVFFVLNTLVVIGTVVLHELIAERYLQQPLLAIFPAAALLCVIVAWLMVRKGRYFVAFLLSGAMIAGLLFSAAIGLYPNLLVSSLNSGVQPDDLQRGFAAQYADRDADHRRDRYAVCAAVHGRRLLLLPRQGAAWIGELLGNGFWVRIERICVTTHPSSSTDPPSFASGNPSRCPFERIVLSEALAIEPKCVS